MMVNNTGVRHTEDYRMAHELIEQIGYTVTSLDSRGLNLACKRSVHQASTT
jgi:hypothetical protein